MRVGVHIQRLEQATPASKLADVEVHFLSGVLTGLKLVGFGVWPGRSGPGYTVTFPAKPYKVEGRRRYFAVLRPAGGAGAESELRHLILDAYSDADDHGVVGTQGTELN